MTIETKTAFLRTGEPHGEIAADRFDKRGKADLGEFATKVTCPRCGGAGGADKWKFTGWTCFECGGNREVVRMVRRVVYTRERLDALNAAQAKRDATLVRKAQERAEREAIERTERADAFRAEFGQMLADADTKLSWNGFVMDIVTRARERAEITERGAEIVREELAKHAEREAKRAASDWIGEIGKRAEFRVTFEREKIIRSIGWDGRPASKMIYTFRDDQNNALVWFTGNDITIADENGDRLAERGDRFVIKATPAEHKEFNGERQTTVKRVAIVEATPRATETA